MLLNLIKLCCIYGYYRVLAYVILLICQSIKFSKYLDFRTHLILSAEHILILLRNCYCSFVDFLLSSWLYRIRPSVTHEPFKSRVPAHGRLVSEFDKSNSSTTPTQLRWRPEDIPDSPTDFIDGLYTICGTGSSFLRHGYAIHM